MSDTVLRQPRHGGGRHVPSPEVLEAALSVRAKRLRLELLLGLLEPFVDGHRSARSMLAEFRRAELALTTPRPARPSPADQGLQQVVDAVDSSGVAAGPWSEEARRYLAGGVRHWDRLRQVGRSRGRPVLEWEVFHALSRLADAQGRGPDGRMLDVQDIEEAMDMPGLGPSWSLHTWIRETRALFEPRFRPADPEHVARKLLQVDAARQLLKPGGPTAGITPGPDPAGSAEAIDPQTMRLLAEHVRRQRALMERVTTAYSLELLRNGAARTAGAARAVVADVDQAIVAGAAIVRARAAAASAAAARARDLEQRPARLASSSTALYLIGMILGGALLLVGLFNQAAFSVTVVPGLAIALLSVAANVVKDWKPNSATVLARPRARLARRLAAATAELETIHIDRLYRPNVSRRQRCSLTWRTARAAVLDVATHLVATAAVTRPTPPPTDPGRHAQR